MGFFKKLTKGIGGALKGVTKMISINNAVKFATGNVAGLGKELVSRSSGALMGAFTEKYDRSTPSQTNDYAGQVVQNAMDRTANTINNAIVNNAVVQKAVDDATKTFSKLWFQIQWAKHKKTMLTLGAIILCGIPLLIYFLKRKNGTKSKKW